MNKKRYLILLLIALMLSITSFSAVNLSITDHESTESIGGSDLPVDSNGNFTLNYSVPSPGPADVLRIWGPSKFEVVTNNTSGTLAITGLTDGDYTFWAERYSGEVTVAVENGTITVPEMSHTVTTTPGTVSVTVDPHPEQTIDVDDATITIPGGTVFIEGGSTRLIVDRTGPVLSNTNFYTLPERTNVQQHTIEGVYTDNYLGGTVSVMIDGGATYTVSIASKIGTFQIPVNLQQGENKITLIGYDKMGNSYVSNQKTIFYDSAAPTTTEPQITFDPDIKNKYISSANYKIAVEFTDTSEMSVVDPLTVELICKSLNKIVVIPEGANNGWSGPKKWEGSFYVPSELGMLYDGPVKLVVKNGKDNAGNLMTQYEQDDIFKIDTTAPATNSSKPPINNYVEVITPANGTVEEDGTITIRATDTIYTASTERSGKDSTEVQLWVDANGNGTYDDNEKLAFNDTNNADDGTIYTADTLTIRPADLPADKFNVYSCERLKIKVVNLKDSVKAEYGGPNTRPDAEFYLDVNLSTRPEAKFVFWDDENTPQLDKTPPGTPQYTSKAHTKEKNQKIKFNISPANDITNSPNFAIDTESVMLTINGLPYNIKGTNAPYASDALTYTNLSQGSIEVVFDPALNNGVGLAEGNNVVKIAAAKDLNGTSVVPVKTEFILDTSAPTITLIYPQNDWTTFDSTQEIKFNVQDTAPGEFIGGSIEVSNTASGGSKTIGEGFRADTPSVNGQDMNIYYNSESGDIICEHKDGESFEDSKWDVKITVNDKAGNQSESTFSFWVLNDMEAYIAGITTLTKDDKLTVTGALRNFPEDLKNYTNVYVQAMILDGPREDIPQQQDVYFKNMNDTSKEVNFDFSNVKLNPGTNLIELWVYDQFGNAVQFNTSEQAYNVIYDNLPPQGNYNFTIKENQKAYVKVSWDSLTDTYAPPVSYRVEVAVEESFSTIIKKEETTSTESIVTMDDFPYANYYIRVIAIDKLGNEALPSSPLVFSVDKQRPIVQDIVIQDMTPDNSYEQMYPNYEPLPGQMKVLISFNEEMDTKTLLSENDNIRMRLASGIYYTINSGKWINSKVWESVISKSSFPTNYNNSFKFYVQGGKDKLNNIMQNFESDDFYLDSKPDIETPKIFPNPMDDREIMVLIRSLEALKQVPHVNVDSEVVEAKMLKNNWYGASYRINSSQNGIRTLSITLTDINGNTGHWPDDYDEVSTATLNIFKTARLIKEEDIELSDPSGVSKLSVYKGSVEKDSDIYSMVYDEEDTASNNAPVMLRKTVAPSGEELERLTKNIVYAPALVLEKACKVDFGEFDDTKGIVVMRKTANTWEYVKTIVDGKKVSAISDKLGTFAVFKDNVAPVFNLSMKDEEKIIDGLKPIEIQLSENCSGIENATMYLDDREIKRLENGNFIYYPKDYYTEGRHQLYAIAKDNAGNVKKASAIFYAPGSVQINSINVFPNPAASFAQIKYTLDSVPTNVALRIYDVNGRLIYRIDGPATVNGTIIWDLNDKRGNSVANGLYYYKLIVSGNGESERFGKIAVLR